ncbi:MAG: nitrile hydratase accessory protein [Rhodospirillales bacterium]|nr:nitrile hydratase accessory protein [Rhodospirillales bacterium]MDE2318669.1 nitrile hydratase accessory protein [Rhodospirillales bacterium]
MLTHFEQYAVTEMMGDSDQPPRLNGGLCFADEWERTAFGVALALAKNGAFEWESFRHNLMAAISNWEETHALTDSSWNYYDRWLEALEKVVFDSGLATRAELALLLDANG